MLSFNVIEASLSEEFGGTVDIWDKIKDRPEKPISKPESATRLIFRVQVADGEKVTLTEGGLLSKLPGYVNVFRTWMTSRNRTRVLVNFLFSNNGIGRSRFSGG